jgi:hypothetical protein
MTSAFVRHIDEQQGWHNCDEVIKGAEYCTSNYQGTGWDRERKVIIVRVPKSGVKLQPALFESINQFEQYCKYPIFRTGYKLEVQIC